ncbi:hypothetical protein IWW34DRAFT_906754 [Fusarium oxysporum f. sp. albedinis]|nr:hypothetical protein IWW34DRAFT_906754 [Fusarium oxysporum f. sp. albedinis]
MTYWDTDQFEIVEDQDHFGWPHLWHLNTECSILASPPHHSATSTKHHHHQQQQDQCATKQKETSLWISPSPAREKGSANKSRSRFASASSSYQPANRQFDACCRALVGDHPYNERQAYHDLISQSIENWDDEDEKPVVTEWDRSDAKSSCRDFTQRSALLNTLRISLRLYQLAPVTTCHISSGSDTSRCQQTEWPIKYYTPSCSATSCPRSWCIPGGNRTLICLPWACAGLPYVVWMTVAAGRSKRQINVPLSEPSTRPSKSVEILLFRQDAFEQDRVPSALSDLLCEIGRAVSDEESAPPQSILSFKPEWDYSTDEALKAWTAGTTDKDVFTKDKLPILYELAYKDMFRHRIYYEREPTPTSESESSDEDVAGPSRNCRSRNIVRDNDDDEAGTRRNTPDPDPSLDRPASRRSDGEDPGSDGIFDGDAPHNSSSNNTRELL